MARPGKPPAGRGRNPLRRRWGIRLPGCPRPVLRAAWPSAFFPRCPCCSRETAPRPAAWCRRFLLFLQAPAPPPQNAFPQPSTRARSTAVRHRFPPASQAPRSPCVRPVGRKSSASIAKAPEARQTYTSTSIINSVNISVSDFGGAFYTAGALEFGPRPTVRRRHGTVSAHNLLNGGLGEKLFAG